MKLPASTLAAGDVIRINDWQLHVVAVDQDIATAVLTAEFDFPLHFARHESVEVVDAVRERFAAARPALGVAT